MLKTLCAIALLLCACGAKVMAASAPTQPPPPPPTVGALVTDALRAFGGEWQLVSIDAKPVERTDVLIVWAPAFSFGSGCEAATGQLRDIGAGRFAIQHYGMPLLDAQVLCRHRHLEARNFAPVWQARKV